MLTQQNNELLCRVGRGTPMGNLMREFWTPFLLSSELSTPDCDPVRVRLFGENLIAFRDTQGRIGLLGDNCPHRGASLFYARNEDCGLRCVYHGWQFDVTGQCIDMPTEPPESNFKERVKHTAYPCVEKAGAIWTYMGTSATPPPLPNFEWMGVPPDHCILGKRIQYCNWAQALEGEFDSSHLGFAHTTLDEHSPMAPEDEQKLTPTRRFLIRDKQPRFEALDTDYGVLVAAQRNADEDTYFYRISQFLLPFWTVLSASTVRDNPTRDTRAFIPIDDQTVLIFVAMFHPLRPLTEQERGVLKTGGGGSWVGTDHFLPPSTEPYGGWRPIASAANDFLLDRDLQRTKTFTGIPEFWAQDAALQESMGPIYDRTQERLGASDTAIIRMRKRLLDVAMALRDRGELPMGWANPEVYNIRATIAVLPRDIPWLEGTEATRRVIPGTNPGGTDVGVPAS